MTEHQFAPVRWRHLMNESELEDWFDFIHGIFKEKTTRQYFVNHHRNDPYSDFNSILLATIPKTIQIVNNQTNMENVPCFDSEQIIGSVKIFHRKIQINNISKYNHSMIQECKCEGIGEVGTRVDMRGKGISRSLLSLAIQQMKNDVMNDSKIVISSLHCAPSVSELYRKLGWKSIPMHYSTILLTASPTNNNNEPHNFKQIMIEKLDFSKIRAEVMQLYSEFCQTCQFHGCEVRSENTEYWSKWIAHESTTHQCSALALYLNSKIIAYLIVGPESTIITNSENLKVKEFVCSSALNTEESWQAFSTLVIHYLWSLRPEHQILLDTLRITLPNALLSQVFKTLKQSKITITMNHGYHITINEIKEKSTTDVGYMYRMIQPEDNLLLDQLIHEDKHLVWKTDGF